MPRASLREGPPPAEASRRTARILRDAKPPGPKQADLQLIILPKVVFPGMEEFVLAKGELDLSPKL
jgi:hypothetical protein